ncbi:MAG: DUF2939 domain-containing protein [Pseudomonadota bacterium]
MRGLATKLLLAISLMGGSLYVASPFYAAWSIRQAMKTNDVALLKQKVDWVNVRSSLRQSIATHAQLLPAAIAEGRKVRPTMWQRIKAVFGASMLDRFMEQYITPHGLPKLYRLKNGYRTRVTGLPRDEAMPVTHRVQGVVSRIHRAEFKSLSLVELEIEDRDQPDRRIIAELKLIGFEWKLSRLSVISAPLQNNTLDDEAQQLADDIKNGRLHYVRQPGA